MNAAGLVSGLRCLFHGLVPSLLPLLAASMACHTLSGVAGMSIWQISSGTSAFTTAFMTEPRAPAHLASPQPFTPRGLARAGSGATDETEGRNVDSTRHGVVHEGTAEQLAQFIVRRRAQATPCPIPWSSPPLTNRFAPSLKGSIRWKLRSRFWCRGRSMTAEGNTAPRRAACAQALRALR